MLVAAINGLIWSEEPSAYAGIQIVGQVYAFPDWLAASCKRALHHPTPEFNHVRAFDIASHLQLSRWVIRVGFGLAPGYVKLIALMSCLIPAFGFTSQIRRPAVP